MTEHRQLVIGGGEEAVAEVAGRISGLTPTQYAIMRLARRPEGVRAKEAGAIIHAARNGGRGCQPGRAGAKGVARGGHVEFDGPPCCPWMSGDGSEAIKRLRERGLLVQRVERGPWYAAPAA